MHKSTSPEVTNAELSAVDPALAAGGDFLRGILAGCGDCIKVLDLDGRLQFMSEGGKRVMEVDDFAKLKGCPWPDFWAGEGNSQAIDAIAQAKAGRTSRFKNAADTAKGTPRYWDVQVSPIFGADGKPTHLLSISRDITEEWKAAEIQKQSVERQKFLTEELTHRVKNTLATVMAMAHQSFRDETHRQARQIFSARIQTLSDAYNVLTEANWTDAAMDRVVESALAPYRTGEGRFSVDGARYEIRPNQAITMALAVNELATNAMKYGALSVKTGHVDIRWSVSSAGGAPRFHFSWTESGGPNVVSPTRVGFGSRLIKTMLALDFAGTVDLRYEPTGLVCALDAPAA